MKFTFIHDHRNQFQVEVMCHVFDVTRAGYYAWLDRPEGPRAQRACGNCYDNAVVESFWGKLKTEMVNHTKFETKREAQRAIFEYIEMF